MLFPDWLQALGGNRRFWPGRGLTNLLRRFLFTPGEESLDHVKRDWDKEDRDR